MTNLLKYSLTFVFGLVIGATIFNTAKNFFSRAKYESSNLEVHLGQQGLINPLLSCNSDLFKSSPKSSVMEGAVQNAIDEITKNGEVEEVSMYFRDLANGPIFSINPDTLFIGASLNKLPVLIAYLKYSESSPELLDSEVTYEPKKLNLPQYIYQSLESPEGLVSGQKYSIRELLRRMIVHSDNLSAIVLTHLYLQVDIKKIMEDMGVTTVQKDGELFLTAKSYASMFRILYNATYLNRKNSEYALKLLTESSFKNGLVSSAPGNILVAHKYGERTVGKAAQVHDCGIIYDPRNPYLICIMTRGKSQKALLQTVAKLAKITYEKVQESSTDVID